MSIEINNTSDKITAIGSSSQESLDLSLNSGALVLPKGTTALRPSSPQSGTLRFNIETNTLEMFNGSTWVLPSGSISGGTGLVTSNGTVNSYRTLTAGSGVAITNGNGASAGNIFINFDGSFDQVSDINVSSPVTGDILVNNGTSFVNSPMSDAFNAIIAGNFGLNPWQRGTSLNIVGDNLVSGYLADRFRPIQAVGTGAFTVLRDTDVPTALQAGYATSASHSQVITVASNATALNEYRMALEHNIEGFDLIPLYGRPVTLSFFVKSTLAGTYGCSMFMADGSSGKVFPATYTVDFANTWEFKTITTTLQPGDVTSFGTSAGLSLVFYHSVNSSLNSSAVNNQWQTSMSGNRAAQGIVNFSNTVGNSIKIANITLTPGIVPVKPKYICESMVQKHCERFYEKSYPAGSYAGASTAQGRICGPSVNANFMDGGYFTFNTEKRVTPSLTIYNYVTGAVNSLHGNDGSDRNGMPNIISKKSFEILGTNFNFPVRYNFHYIAIADY